jgi:DHA2 family multidrug resistance protein
VSSAAASAGSFAGAPAQPRAINPWVVAVVVTMATFMELLDTTIANVALPHIAGGLSSGVDEISWPTRSCCRSARGSAATSAASATT